MRNFSTAFLMAVLSVGSRKLKIYTAPEIIAGIIAFTIIWWCVLTWFDELAERRRKNA